MTTEVPPEAEAWYHEPGTACSVTLRLNGDPDGWEMLVEHLMEYPSVTALRRAEPNDWSIPLWWPGQKTTEDDDGRTPVQA